MPNLGYQRSRRREYQVKHLFEKDGWYCIRAAGSKGEADIVCLRPTLTNPKHFEARFIQVKTSRKIKFGRIDIKTIKTPIGFLEIEYWLYPSRKK
mgnify:CR=1 FL=1